MRSRVAIGVVVTGVLAIFGSATAAEPRQPYSGVVVFGTSLSDPGNAFALQHVTNTPRQPRDPLVESNHRRSK